MSALSTPGSTTPAAYRGQGRGGARLADLVWLTWRQHRAVIIAGLAVAGVVTGSMLYVAARIATINHQCGNTACPPGSAQAAPLTGLFGLTNLSIYLTIIVTFLPLLAGVFLGAPLLAREHEQRTLLLAWSQDITPQRWLWTKFALLGVLTAAAAAAVSAAAGHLADMVSIATGKSLFSLFSGTGLLVTGMLPLVAQTVAWLAIGVALGAAYRRTLPAIFTALTSYIAVLFLVLWRYPTLMTPLTALLPFTVNQYFTSRLGANILVMTPRPSYRDTTDTIYDASGHATNLAGVQSLCPGHSGSLDDQCVAQHHFMEALRYQPGSRIPDFHLILACDYFALGAIAVAVVWWLVRRTSLSAG
jgi:ABC-type transport system involved in multi-copper enzyme maturation permease subunit